MVWGSVGRVLHWASSEDVWALKVDQDSDASKERVE